MGRQGVLVYRDASNRWAADLAADLLQREKGLRVEIVSAAGARDHCVERGCEVWLLQMAAGGAAKVFGPEGAFERAALRNLLDGASTVGVLFAAVNQQALSPLLFRRDMPPDRVLALLAQEQPFFAERFGGHPVSVAVCVYSRLLRSFVVPPVGICALIKGAGIFVPLSICSVALLCGSVLRNRTAIVAGSAPTPGAADPRGVAGDAQPPLVPLDLFETDDAFDGDSSIWSTRVRSPNRAPAVRADVVDRRLQSSQSSQTLAASRRHVMDAILVSSAGVASAGALLDRRNTVYEVLLRTFVDSVVWQCFRAAVACTNTPVDTLSWPLMVRLGFRRRDSQDSWRAALNTLVCECSSIMGGFAIHSLLRSKNIEHPVALATATAIAGELSHQAVCVALDRAVTRR